jgi:glycosyltransferase involved in cell wall biosynthesis/GT2 family glycosyltransferase
MRVALVTEEFHPVGGGIGTAFHELASLLVRHGHEVALYMPQPRMSEDVLRWCREAGVSPCPVAVHKHSWKDDAPGRSWAFLQALRASEVDYDVIHFHEYFGSAFYALKAKRQGIALQDSRIVVQMHGPSEWALSMNGALPRNDEDLKIAFLERWTVENSDLVVAPSQYIVDWARRAGWAIAESVVLPNLRSEFAHHWSGRNVGREGGSGVVDLVFLGRQEERKGLREFLLTAAQLAKGFKLRVHVLGGFGEIGHLHSGLFLIDWARKWGVSVTVRAGLSRTEALRYIFGLRNPLVVVPSVAENSPYTVVETALAGLPVVFSARGGAIELFRDDEVLDRFTFDGTSRGDLERCLSRLLASGGGDLPRLAHTERELEDQWVSLHAKLAAGTPPRLDETTDVTVAVAIVHFERPNGLLDAVKSALMQSRLPDQIVVVDDGSRSDAAVEALNTVEQLLERSGLGEVIRQDNAYLGAARNAALARVVTSHVIFLDDDNLLLPHAVERLCTSARAIRADGIAAVSMFMPSQDRSLALADPQSYREPVSFLPLGGPLSMGLLENVFGDATGIFSVERLRDLSGFSELYGVGYEDYELYLRIAADSGRVDVCPDPVYLYQIGDSSMITETSAVANHARVVNAVERLDAKQVIEPLTLVYRRVAGERSLEEARGRAHWLAARVFDQATIDRLSPWRTPEAEAVTVLTAVAEKLNVAGVRFVAGPLAPVTETEVKSTRVLEVPAMPGRVAAMTDPSDPVDSLVLRASVSRASRDESAQLLREVDLLLSEAAYPQRTTLDALRVLLLLRVGERGRAKTAFSQGFRVDEDEYSARYPDVAQQVEQRVFSSGLRHFNMYGRQEGRVGYAFVRQLERLASTLGTDGVEPLIADAEASQTWSQRLKSAGHDHKSG